MKSVKLITLAAVLTIAASACASEPTVSDKLKKLFPRLTFESVFPSPVTGIYEVTAGNNVLYFDPVSGYLNFGEWWSPQGVNVTAAAKNKIMAAKYDLFKEHLKDAIKIGSGPNEVIEIIDPDCPFCRRMATVWKDRPDVTRYVFFFPLKTIHPDAEAHVAYILAAAQPAEALADIEAGKLDNNKITELPAAAGSRIKAHAELAARSGLNGVPAYFVNKQFVNGANWPAIQKLLTAKGETK